VRLAFVACHYNPSGFVAPVRNFKAFLRHFTPHGGVHVVELVLPGRAPDLGPSLPGTNTYRRLDGGSVLWQKERLLNEGLSPLMKDHDALCWLDGDLVFIDPTFRRRVEEAFTRGDLVQLFARSMRMEKDWTEDFCRGRTDPFAAPSLTGLALGLYQRRPWAACDPGLAWGATTEWLDRVGGLFDAGVLGGGDTFMLHGCREGRLAAPGFTPGFARAFDLWAHRARGTRVGWADGTVLHLYHGSFPNRRYADRYEIALKHDYDPAADVRVEGGAWVWDSAKPDFHREVAEYFLGRREDD
jgi:hypothetical protein